MVTHAGRSEPVCRIPHVRRRNGRYVFRRRVHFRNIISKPLALALQTADPSLARGRAALLSARFAVVKSSVNKMIEAGRALNKAEIEALFREELEGELRALVQHAFEDRAWASAALEIAADNAGRYRMLSLPDRDDGELLQYVREMISDETIAARLAALGAPVDSGASPPPGHTISEPALRPVLAFRGCSTTISWRRLTRCKRCWRTWASRRKRLSAFSVELRLRPSCRSLLPRDRAASPSSLTTDDLAT